MKSIFRNSFAVIIGLAAGSVLNMALVTIAPLLIPPPEGVDVTDMESIAANIHRYGPEQFIFPFFAHALGTLAGAMVAYLIGISHQAKLAYGIGVAFLAGGISVTFLIPTPTWYLIIDLLFAYLPMAWLGIQLAKRFRKESAS